MTSLNYSPADTGYLLVDPYNDFISEGGKLWGLIKETAEEANLLPNLRALDTAVRSAGVQVFYVPHHRSEPGDVEKWQNPSPSQARVAEHQMFARGEWGGEWHPDFVPKPGDIIAQEHWGQSGFANTDLDFLLKQCGIKKVIVVGLVANTCIESTARYAMELGYHVTLVKDATAAFSKEGMHTAHEVNGPAYAHEILTTAELIQALPVLEAAE